MGLYNSPVSSKNFHARVYYGGVNSWFNLSTPRAAGWHKLTALIGDTSVKFLVDDALVLQESSHTAGHGTTHGGSSGGSQSSGQRAAPGDQAEAGN